MSETFAQIYRERLPDMVDSPACPIRWMLDRVGERWSLYVLCWLSDNGESRFGDIQRGVPAPISNRMLTLTLEKLCADGLVARRETRMAPLYDLTDLGRSLMEPMRKLVDWTVAHARELDAARRKFGVPPLDLPPHLLQPESAES